MTKETLLLRNKKRITVIEDDEGILDVMQTILQIHGYEVEISQDDSILKNKRAKLPDLIILDIWMKDGDGREICKNLKSKSDTKHIPVIMVSATRELTISAEEAGADDFLEKPFEIEDLVQKVKRLI